ncbi:rCG63353 [Rattus norvegicus]|uniref:RCG63353 n=1 Tax=Rattus norvegicus TaxID=10116 RepID=A6IIP8_RAT|nr:rCG63353 [Rattus norvegicus]
MSVNKIIFKLCFKCEYTSGLLASMLLTTSFSFQHSNHGLEMAFSVHLTRQGSGNKDLPSSIDHSQGVRIVKYLKDTDLERESPRLLLWIHFPLWAKYLTSLHPCLKRV